MKSRVASASIRSRPQRRPRTLEDPTGHVGIGVGDDGVAEGGHEQARLLDAVDEARDLAEERGLEHDAEQVVGLGELDGLADGCAPTVVLDPIRRHERGDRAGFRGRDVQG